MLYELYIEAYITLANYITLIIFVFCAMFNNNLRRYVLAEREKLLDVSSSEMEGEEAKETTAVSATMYNDVWQRGDSSNAPIRKIICRTNYVEKKN